MQKTVSTCCNSSIRVEGRLEKDNYYVCNKCNEPCDVIDKDFDNVKNKDA